MERLNRTPRGRARKAAWLLPFLVALLLAPSWVRAANNPPTVSAINDLRINENTSTPAISFTIGDDTTPVASLQLSASSSDTNIVRTNGIVFGGGTGASRTVQVTPRPNASGSVTISVHVTDGDGATNTETFVLTVNALPTITSIGNRTINEDADTGAISFTIGDAETDADSLILIGRSANHTLVPDANIVFGGSGSNRTVTVTPVADENGSSTITIFVSDGTGGTNSEPFTLTVTPQPDSPEFSGTSSTTLYDNQTGIALFTGVTAFDVDQGRPNNETLDIAVTLGPPGQQLAQFQTEQLTFSGLPSQVTTQLRAVLFDTIPNRLRFGQSGQVIVTVTATDSTGRKATNTGTITILASNDPPTFTVTVNPANITDNQNVTPFTLSISDPDPGDDTNTFTVAITQLNGSAYGSLQPPTLFTGSKAAVEAAVAGVQFATIHNSASGDTNIQFSFQVTDAHAGSASGPAQLQVHGINDAPDIAGVSTLIFRITDDPTQPPLFPFQNVTIADADEGGLQHVTVTLSVDDPAKGVLSQTNFSGTGTQVTAQIRVVSFMPLQRPNRVVGETVTATLKIAVVDVLGSPRENSNTRVAITSVNGAPQILGIPSDQPALIPPPVLPSLAVSPFRTISITDDTTNALTVTVTIDNTAKGVLSNLTSGGFALVTNGVYRIITNATAATRAISNLQFVVSQTFVFPPNAPGGTTFTIEAVDSVLNTTRKTHSIIIQLQPRNHLVTRFEDDFTPGSLRNAVTNASNNDMITFAFSNYPVVIRLRQTNGPLVLRKNISFKGPGADRLTISGDSNGDRNPDTQLFRVHASVVMEGLALTDGNATGGDTVGTGGAIYVGTNGALVMRYCAISNSTAAQWGGAIDVDRGSLVMSNCLVRGNSTSIASGLGGGAISIYTDEACVFVNTTFSGNRQRSNGGYGGGAIYAENYTPNTSLSIVVLHCTFKENDDAAELGSSIMANVFGTEVHVRNSIFADGHGGNLEVEGAGEIISEGGNISDDAARTILTQGGQPQSVILLDQPTDLTETDPLLGPLDAHIAPTPAHPLLAGSPAIGHAVAEAAALDQRGVIRDAAPDSGAIEFGAAQRVVINEIQFAVPGQNFIELYVPRDSMPVDFTGFHLALRGIVQHTFSNRVVQPGFGIIVAEAALAASNTPVVIASLTSSNRGAVAVTDIAGRPLAEAAYNGVFVDPFDPVHDLSFPSNSLTLLPQFIGFAYVPHSFASAQISSPGADTHATPFGSPNAYPVAVGDNLIVDEDKITSLDVLNNDADADGLDRLVILDVSQASSAGSGSNATATSTSGALISINPSATPLRGTAISYDPRSSTNIQRLPVGAELTDSFYYEIIDIGTGPITLYSGTPGSAPTTVLSPGHRLVTTDLVSINGAGNPVYNGDHAIIRVDDDTFTINVPFGGDVSNRGSWITKEARNPSARSEAKVTLTVIGVNDPPVAGTDNLSTDEETILRIMADTNLLGSSVVFATDPLYPLPRQMAGVALLRNDDDIDTDDDFKTLKVVGVVRNVTPVVDYLGTFAVSPVTVKSPGHNLVTGTRILISGYGGDASYNRYHIVTVVDADTFTIPVAYVDNNPTNGVWAVLADTNRLAALSEHGAQVNLEIRADRIETSVVYNPRASTNLNSLSLGQITNDTFYYAVEDSHGAAAFGKVVVQVTGVNDAPVPRADPPSLGGLLTLTNSSQSLQQVVTQLVVQYFLPPASGNSNRTDVQVQFDDQPGVTFFLADLWTTDEDTPLPISSADLLGNDSDVDQLDALTVKSVSALSWQGAALTLSSNHLGIVYDPTAATAAALNALAREETVIDTFFAVVTDSRGADVTNLVAVLVVGRNDTPVAQDDSTATPEDVLIAFDPIHFPPTNSARWDFDVDINGHAPDNTLYVVPVTNLLTPGGARVNIASNLLTYDPSVSAFLDGLALGQTFLDTFRYEVSDSSFVFANDDLFKVAADGSGYALDVLANDRNLNTPTSALQIVAVGQPSQGGAATVNADGTRITYTPQVNFVGEEVFTYKVSDEFGNEDSAIVRVRATVNQLNGNLQANADRFSVAKGEAPLLDVLANDNIIPASGSALTITRIVSSPVSDSVAITNNRIRYFQQSAGPYPYTATFSYEVSGGGTARAVALVTVVVTNRENTLSVRDDAFSIAIGAQNSLLDVLANDTILPGAPATLTIREIVDAPDHGSAVLDPTKTALLYSPNNGFVGEDVLVYRATDGLGGTATGTVRIAVGSLTTSPDFFVVAWDDPSSTNDNGATPLDVLANDAVGQPTPEAVTILSVTPTSTALGAMSISGDGTRLLFNPATSAVGEQEFIYTIRDGSTPPRTAEGRVTVVVVQSGVTANPDYFAVLQDSSGNEINVLVNDAVVPNEGRPLTIVQIGAGLDGPNHGGTVVINATNDRLLYTPAPGFVGEETFTYSMTDSRGTDTARVAVRVTAGDLIANDDAFTVFFEPQPTNAEPHRFTLPVLANDRVLPDLGQLLTIVGVGIDDINATNAPDRQGEVTISPDGASLLYLPRDDDGPFPYVERFTYEITDGSQRRAEGVIVIEVQQRTSIREIETHDDAYTVEGDSTENALAVLVNDNVKPASASGWTITEVTAPSNGVAVINGPLILYTPQPGFVGTDTFRYSVSDGFGGTGHADVTVKVGDVSVCPDIFVALSGTTNNELPVLVNDLILPDTGKLFFLGGLGAPDRGGTVAVNSNRTTILYAPNPDYQTNNPARYPYEEHFWYDVLDDSGNAYRGAATVNVFKNGSDRDDALVSITVIGVNDAPTITGAGLQPLITDKQTGTPFANVRIHDVDDQGKELLTVTVIIDDIAKGVLTNLGGFVQGPPGTYIITNIMPTNVTAAIRGLVFVPTENRIIVPTIENTIFTILANDTHVTTTNTVTQPVLAVNDPPLISGTVSGLRVYHRGTIRPFYKTLITEVDDSTTQALVIRVTLDIPNHGYFTALSGFVSNAPGIYTLSNATAASATAALRAIIFVPTTANRVVLGSNETTRLTISVNDGFAPPVLDTNTTVTAIAGLVARLQQAVKGESDSDDRYGSAVAATRDFVAVGEPEDDNNNETGSAFVYARRLDGSEAWDEVKKLYPPGGHDGDLFGFSMGMSGETLVVGAPHDPTRGSSAGAAFIFSRNQGGSNQWGFIAKITAADGAASDEFAYALAIDGDTIAVGSRGDDDRGSSSGSVYLFARSGTNWVQVRKVTASDGLAGDELGFSVALNADTLVAGAHGRDQTGANSGAAYVFSRNLGGSNQWGQVKKLLPGDAGAGDEFGFSVSVDKDTIAVGAPFNDDLGSDSGSAYVFARDLGGSNQWGQVKKLLPVEGGSSSDNFGYSVGVDGDNIVIGSPDDSANGSDSGSAYLFNRNAGGTNQWNETERFVPGNNADNGKFGYALAISHSTLVIGAPFEEPGGGKTGTIYIYRLKYGNAPMLLNPIPDQYSSPNVSFSFVLPPNTFGDPDAAESLVLSTGILPTWLSFNPFTGAFSGTPTFINIGTSPITVIATDEDGQSAVGAFNIGVGVGVDTTPPVITCPPSVTVQCDADVPAPDFVGGSVSDNTDPWPGVVHVGDVTNGVCPKIITRTYRATDYFGNFATCAQTITVQDTTPPTINCGTNTTVQFGLAWNFTVPIVSDNCGGTVNLGIFSTATNVQCGATFIATRVWLATDTCGNSTTCTQVVTVIDTLAPSMTCPANVTVACTASVPAPNFAGGSVFDLADPNPTVVHVGDASSGTNPRIITRTYRAIDACGNSNTCTQTITVHDTVAPTITCPADIVVAASTNTCTATNVALGTPTVVDNCTTTVTNNAPLAFPLGVTLVTWIATDAAGNSATCTQRVTIVDSTLAITSPPQSQTNNIGSNTVFTVTATGCAELLYQWNFGTNLMAGATNATLTLTNIQYSQGGDYKVRVSNAGGSTTSIVAVLTVNRPPLATNDGAATTRNQAVTISSSGLLSNDSDPDLDVIALASVSATSTNGAVVSWSGGDVTYTPVLNFTGVDRFSYTITDGRGATAPAAVEVFVASALLPPVDQLSIFSTTNGSLILYHGTPGKTYELQRSLDAHSWASISTNTSLHGIIEYVETNGPSGGAFYRVFKP